MYLKFYQTLFFQWLALSQIVRPLCKTLTQCQFNQSTIVSFFFIRVIYQRFLDQAFLCTSNMRNHFDKATVGDFSVY